MNHRTKTKPKKMTAECLYCGENIYIGHNPKVGNFVTCDSCDTQFEIVDLDPVMVDWPYYDDDFDGDESFSYDIDDEYSYRSRENPTTQKNQISPKEQTTHP